MKRKHAEISTRLTGFSTPLFGVSWEPPTSDVAVARRVMAFLEDRRVLYEPSDVELADHCILSVIEIRRFLTEVLGDGGIAAELADQLRAMRSSCRRFLRSVGADDGRGDRSGDDDFWLPHSHGRPIGLHDWGLNQALGELRATFGIHIALIAVQYGIDVEEDLATILPSNDDQD